MDARKMTDQLLEAAACEALGTNSPTESAAFQQELAAAGEDARRVDRELRETVARLSASSPHMKPPADLRGRILQATAPVTFRMEDYRKATREPSRFYKWGFYAAMLFLMAAAWFNLSLQGSMKQVVAQAQGAMQERDKALSTLLAPNVQQVTLKNNDGQAFGRVYRNEEARTAVVILPEGLVPVGKTVELTMPGNDGARVAYKTTLIKAPNVSYASGSGAMPGSSIETVLTIDNASPDLDARHPLESRPKVAGQGK